MWQQPELVSELESDLSGIADWSTRCLVDFNARKTQLVSSDHSDNCVGADTGWSLFKNFEIP